MLGFGTGNGNAVMIELEDGTKIYQPSELGDHT